jgi:AcrR family transcriptional regulator
MPGPDPSAPTLLVERVLDAAQHCVARWGIQKVTVDDIASEAQISRATLYRLFPGGREVLFDAMRERSIREFLAELDLHLAAADSLEELTAGILTHAIGQLRSDADLQLALASRPGEVALDLGVDSMPNIIRLSTTVFGPRLAPFLDDTAAAEMAEWLSRAVVSYFLAPSSLVDLGDPEQASAFVRRFLLPAFAHKTQPVVG